jgi:3-oxoacyl-[acyl-carrier-protein] synthase II
LTTRIVVTGTGVISSIGAGFEEFEKALFEGRSGIGPRTLFTDTVPAGTAGEIRNFSPQEWLGKKGLRVLDRSARLVCVASHMALQASGLTQPEGDEGDPNIGLVLGTMFGSVHSITSFDWSGLVDGPNLVNPMEFPNTVINSPAGQAAIKHKLRGVNSTISAGLVSGLYAIHYAMEFLRFGRATALLSGGVEELCEESYLSYAKAGWLSPSGRPAPFDPESDGSVIGEGSALLMLETEEGARKRGIRPLLEVCGFGSAHDAHDINSFNPRGNGAASAIHAALQAANIAPESIACIVASAGGNRAGDAMESHALKEVFGGRLEHIPVSAPKAAFGDCLGATGALLALSAGAALVRQEAPPTAGYRTSAHGLRLSSEAQPFSGDYALVDCFGCDGNNAALVLKRI